MWMHQQQDRLVRAWETRSQAERRTSQRSDVVGHANGWRKVELKLDLKRRRSARQRVEVRPARTWRTMWMHQQVDLLLRAWETRSQTERRTSQRSDVVGRAHRWQKVELKLELKLRTWKHTSWWAPASLKDVAAPSDRLSAGLRE